MFIASFARLPNACVQTVEAQFPAPDRVPRCLARVSKPESSASAAFHAKKTPRPNRAKISTTLFLLGVLLPLASAGCLVIPFLWTEWPVPPEYQLHVAHNDIGLVRTLIWEGEAVGSVSDIRVGEFDLAPGREIAIAGRKGAAIVSSTFSELQTVAMSDQGENHRIIPSAPHSRPKYVAEQGEWVNDIRRPILVLRDGAGKVSWTRDGYALANESPANFGDVDGDGQMEIAVEWASGFGLVDISGQTLWTVTQIDSEDFYDVFIADADHDQQLELLAIDRDDRMKAYDMAGELRFERALPESYESPQPVRFSTSERAEHLLFDRYFATEIIDLEGTQVFAFDMGPEWRGPSGGTSVVLKSDADPYFAVIGKLYWAGGYFAGAQEILTELQIFDAAGKLVYREVLADGDLGFAVLPDETTGTERLLLGTTNRVYAYSLQEGE